MDSSIIILVIGSVFLGSLMRSTFGFGDSVVSMPLLALLPIPFSDAVALVGLVGFTVALLSVFSSWKHLDKTVLKWLSATTLIGIPFGLFLVQSVDPYWVNLALGLLLLSYAAYALFSSQKRMARMHRRFENNTAAVPFGFLSGMLGSAYNMNGIPIVLYGTMKNWAPTPFKNNLQAHFIISSSLIIFSHFLSGFWTRDVGVYYLFSLPAIVLAILAGNALYARIDTNRFRRYVLWLIFFLGLSTLLNTLL
ncbi:MAG: sulfite exporter TauE/SafE family protein [Alkalibacterium sp.]|nr:sulfite exporter TauE/SafE family protein [Alkalibacterium sp.]TVP93119.1 MAG: sulfite exporter TauE/SafE family protein [Alkalibacterium sp.]